MTNTTGITVYQFFDQCQGYMRFPRMNLTTKAIKQETRIIKDVDNRGAFYYRPHVATNKAELYVTMRDSKTRDTNTDSYGYTNVVIARHDNNRHGFVFINPVVEAVVSKEMHEALYEMGAVQGDYIPNDFCRVDLTRLQIFPLVAGNYNHMRDSLDRSMAVVEALCKVRDGARKYFQYTGHIPVNKRVPKDPCAGDGEPQPEAPVERLIPVTITDNHFYVVRSGAFDPEVMNYKASYRLEKKANVTVSAADYERFRLADKANDAIVIGRAGVDYICKLKRHIYLDGCLEEINELIKMEREAIDALKDLVRLQELRRLELNMAPPAGFSFNWMVNKYVKHVTVWQAIQLRRQGAHVVSDEELVEA